MKYIPLDDISVPVFLINVSAATLAQMLNLDDGEIGLGIAQTLIVSEAVAYSEGKLPRLYACGFMPVDNDSSEFDTQSPCALETNAHMRRLHGLKPYLLFRPNGKPNFATIQHFADRSAALEALAATS